MNVLLHIWVSEQPITGIDLRTLARKYFYDLISTVINRCTIRLPFRQNVFGFDEKKFANSNFPLSVQLRRRFESS